MINGIWFSLLWNLAPIFVTLVSFFWLVALPQCRLSAENPQLYRDRQARSYCIRCLHCDIAIHHGSNALERHTDVRCLYSAGTGVCQADRGVSWRRGGCVTLVDQPLLAFCLQQYLTGCLPSNAIPVQPCCLPKSASITPLCDGTPVNSRRKKPNPQRPLYKSLHHPPRQQPVIAQATIPPRLRLLELYSSYQILTFISRWANYRSFRVLQDLERPHCSQRCLARWTWSKERYPCLSLRHKSILRRNCETRWHMLLRHLGYSRSQSRTTSCLAKRWTSSAMKLRWTHVPCEHLNPSPISRC